MVSLSLFVKRHISDVYYFVKKQANQNSESSLSFRPNTCYCIKNVRQGRFLFLKAQHKANQAGKKHALYLYLDFKVTSKIHLFIFAWYFTKTGYICQSDLTTGSFQKHKKCFFEKTCSCKHKHTHPQSDLPTLRKSIFIRDSALPQGQYWVHCQSVLLWHSATRRIHNLLLVVFLRYCQ